MAKTATVMKLKERMETLDETPPPIPVATKIEAQATPDNIPGSAALDELRPETLSYLPQPEGEGRKGKRATVGHFSQAMSRKLNALAALEGRTLQSIMGEAWDMWLASRNQPPFNER